jgi:hypothetical protein
MTSSLIQALDYIKSAALSAGFVDVKEYGFNINSNPDTLLPRMFIKVTGIRFDKQFGNTSDENILLDLIMVANTSPQPISQLYSLQDQFLKAFYQVTVTQKWFIKGKIELIDSTISNDRDIYAAMGGESLTLRIRIQGLNTFGVTT